MNVFFFITKSEQGGAQTHIAQLTEFLVKHGHNVFVMSAQGGWLEQETTRLHATFIANPTLANTANPVRLWKAMRVLRHTVRQRQPDIVACHSTMAGLIGRFALLNSVPVVYTAHGWSFTPGASWLRRLFMPLFEKWAAFFCQKIICVSQQDKHLAVQHHIAPEHKLTMIHNGVEIPHHAPTPPKQNTRREILFVGRLATPKEPDLLLHAITALDTRIRKVTHLTIIGEGPQRTQLQKIIEQLGLHSAVSLAGTRSRNDIFTQLQKTDMLVLPTRYEGFPYTVLEAMAYGVPVIASRVGGIEEAIGNDAGILIPRSDVRALTEALTKLITDPLLRQQLSMAGFRKAQTFFSVEQMCNQTLAVYQEVCKMLRS